MRQHFLVILFGLTSFFLGPGCQRAGRYPPRPAQPEKTDKIKDERPDHWLWLDPVQPTHDIPIVFVTDSSPEWAGLRDYWNMFPSVPAGMPTCYLGLSPLGALSSLVLAEQAITIKIKVPQGLPDPTPHIPRSNPVTFRKWKLGKKLFFERRLAEANACSSCHDPGHGFAEEWAVNRLLGKRNTPTLINSVYNRHFFWDGGANSLEEAIVRPDKEGTTPEESRPQDHAWGKLTDAILADPAYVELFREAFGIRRPTEDAVAKAIATYLRTILSGDSLFDRAERQRRKKGDAELTGKHFEPILDDAALKKLGRSGKAETAANLARGASLFFGKARCHRCHDRPLFCDQDFHNVGLQSSDAFQLINQDLGRFATVPVGRKEARLKGAYKTPTLRALPRTGPYMHLGSLQTLESVVDFFDHGIESRFNDYLAAPLIVGPGRATQLHLDEVERQALVLFLRALDGEPVASVIAGAPK
jgi:cytochrome c peroxidase